jgi:hypothetical protein
LGWLQLNTGDPLARVYDSEQLQQEYVLAQTVLERAQAFELGDDDNHHDDDHHQWLGRSPVPLIYDRKMSFNINVTNSNFGDHIVSGIALFHTHTTAHHLSSHVDAHASVSGPGGQPWFQVVRLNRALLSFEPAQFGIFTMRVRSSSSSNVNHELPPTHHLAWSNVNRVSSSCSLWWPIARRVRAISTTW